MNAPRPETSKVQLGRLASEDSGTHHYSSMMGEHQGSLVLAILSSILLFVITLVFNGLAGPGIYPFLGTTANISGEYETEITPAGWTFAIWSLIYVWLVLMFVYILSGCCRKNSYGYVYCSPPVLSHGFFMAWCMNMGLNTAWLFLWDKSLMIVAAVFLLLIAGSNYIMISFACRGLHVHGAWLSKYHRLDLWLHHLLEGVFGDIGLFKCDPVKIELKPDAEPYTLTMPCRIPFPLLPKVEGEL
ncbi:uncharacterized protein si:ch211-161h7.5 [Gadus chalcogrammus]|uniref:uncharacterized protein si:ch211-161h7.5 n=1 Tax=Gadus chalcogrammus TaxID=1042646 RepID=UPI0024C4B416|nr:uncharacterized protein si:ch211-161h7.5 [Gadus chalcogrammus]